MTQEKSSEKQFATRILSESFQKGDVHGAISMPIYRNAAFAFASSEAIAAAFQNKEEVASHTYSRISNPTVEHLERKIITASGAQSVMAVSSGMAAISNTFFCIAYAGCNIVCSPHLFGNTFSFFQFTLAAFGVEVRFVNTDKLDEIEAAIDTNTCAFFCELITNPHLEIADLKAISTITRAKKIPLIVDTTIVPWCAFDAKKVGIDIEVISTTKYISGGATSIGGAILDYGTFDWTHNARLCDAPKTTELSQFSFKLRREIARNVGACMDSETASLQALGMETLQLRYERMSASAYQLAQWLSEDSRVVKVGYPSLHSSPYKTLSDSLFTGNPGAMLTFSLDSKEACYLFMNRLQIIRRATNLFDNKSLIIHPESTIYGSFSPELKIVMGIEDNLMRLSVGLEDARDLYNDILQALDFSF